MALGPVRGIKYGVQATAGADPSTFIALHARGSTLGVRRRTARTGAGLGLGASRFGTMPSYVDGEITCGFTNVESIWGELIQAVSSQTASPYTLGAGGFVTNPLLGVNVNYGGPAAGTTEYAFRDLIVTKLRLEWRPDSDIQATVGFAGTTEAAVTSPADPSPPASSSLILPSSYGMLTIGGTACTFKRIVYELACGHEFVGLDDVGATNARRALHAGQWSHKLSIDFDYDDASGSNTKALVADLIDATAGVMGTVAVGSMLIATDWYVTGDHPALKSGNIPMSLSGDCSVVTIVTT